MKRGFLFGLTSFLILGVIAGLYQSISGRDLISLIVALVLVAVSLVAFRAAKNAPQNSSKIYAVVGWLLGFFVIDAVIFAVVGIVMIIR